MTNMNKTKLESIAMIENLHIVFDEFDDPNEEQVSLENCIASGFAFVRGGKPVKGVSYTLFNDALSAVGTDEMKFNSTFHKSFETVEKTDINEMIAQQLLHYMSTYGFEALGMKAMPVIPAEELKLPMNTPKFITVIEMVDEYEIYERITDFFCKIKKPSYTLANAFEILIDYVDLSHWDVDKLSSYELQAMYCDKMNIVPQNAISFLRFLNYKITGSPMLNNSARNCELIKSGARWNNTNVAGYFEQANMQNLASIFLRYKNIFLAYKKYDGCAPIINKLRRMADTYHQPLSDISIQNFWQIALAGRTADMTTILNKAEFVDLVKLFNIGAVRISVTNPCAGVFNIRNGRTFVKEQFMQPLEKDKAVQYESILRVLIEEMKKRVSLEGLTFYIPQYILYAAPTSEKQMIGNIPWGTRLSLPNDEAFTFGIAWDNQNGQRVDLDLHMHSNDGSTYGWNGYYRSTVDNEASILFTGDQTDATNGAAEAFYFKPKTDNIYSLDISQYAGPAKTPFKLFMNEVKPTIKREKYTYNPKYDLVPAIPLNVNTDNDCGCTMNLGFVKENTFVFYGGSLTNNIGGNSEYYPMYLDTQVFKCMNQMWLEDLIYLCGGEVIHTMPKEATEEDWNKIINLSPEMLTATTITDIFRVTTEQ